MKCWTDSEPDTFISIISLSFYPTKVRQFLHQLFSGEEGWREEARWGGQEGQGAQSQEANEPRAGLRGGPGLPLPVHSLSPGQSQCKCGDEANARCSVQVPSISPFCLKLESWLKLHGIKYQVGGLSFFLLHDWTYSTETYIVYTLYLPCQIIQT